MAFDYAGAALGAITAATEVAGTALSVKAAKADAKAAQAAAEYNAALAEMEGRAEESRQRRIARRTLSSQFVQMAGKSGVIAEEGGWLEALVWNTAEYETNALNAAIAGRNTAALERSRGRAAKRIGKQRAGAEILAGASRLGGFGLSLMMPGTGPATSVTTPITTAPPSSVLSNPFVGRTGAGEFAKGVRRGGYS